MKKFLCGMIAAVVFFGAGVLSGPRIFSGGNGSDSHSSSAVRNIQFDDIAELSTEELSGQYIYEFTDEKKKLLNIEIPMTGKKILITYDGTAKAGIKNVSDITVEQSDQKNKVITVQVPAVQILDCKTENDQIYDVNDSLFNSFKISDYPDLRKNINEEFRKIAEGTDLLDRTEKSTEDLIRDRVKSYYGDEYTVKIEWQKKE